VQDALEAALEAIAGAKVSTTAAGRTDRGVHARLQVAHFDTDASRPPTAWVRGVNTLLPDAVAVLWSREVPGDFHARYSALARTYRYELLNRPVRAALSAPYVGWFHQPLDAGAMREAAALLVGEHDFSAFRSAECQAKTPVRTIHAFSVLQKGSLIQFEIRANAFLHHMVRNLVGALVYVGKGSLSPAQVKEILRSRDRGKAPPTFAPEGLYLENIEYEPKWGLPL
jgi:tRNA pseudouridine38-40 synthase